MMNNYTSIEQSKKLIELGLNPETADMYYEEVYLDKKGDKVFLTPPHVRKTNFPEHDLPCWSVGALIELMPSFLHDDVGFEYLLSVGKNYVEYINHLLTTYSRYHYEIGDDILEACYNMIVWLLKNNYIKKVHKNEE